MNVTTNNAKIILDLYRCFHDPTKVKHAIGEPTNGKPCWWRMVPNQKMEVEEC